MAKCHAKKLYRNLFAKAHVGWAGLEKKYSQKSLYWSSRVCFYLLRWGFCGKVDRRQKTNIIIILFSAVTVKELLQWSGHVAIWFVNFGSRPFQTLKIWFLLLLLCLHLISLALVLLFCLTGWLSDLSASGAALSGSAWIFLAWSRSPGAMEAVRGSPWQLIGLSADRWLCERGDMSERERKKENCVIL